MRYVGTDGLEQSVAATDYIGLINNNEDVNAIELSASMSVGLQLCIQVKLTELICTRRFLHIHCCLSILS